jgi:hypothetical protein
MTLTGLPSWPAVVAHHGAMADRHLRDLFADDPDRGTRLVAEGAGLYLDSASTASPTTRWRCCSDWPARPA